MTHQEAQLIATAAIKNGILRIRLEQKSIADPKYQAKIAGNRARYWQNRPRFLAQGLTAHGTPRAYWRKDLSGWTPAAKRARLLQQKRNYSKAHYQRSLQ